MELHLWKEEDKENSIKNFSRERKKTRFSYFEILISLSISFQTAVHPYVSNIVAIKSKHGSEIFPFYSKFFLEGTLPSYCW